MERPELQSGAEQLPKEVELSPEEAQRAKRRKYDKARKQKTNFLKRFDREAFTLEEEKEWIARQPDKALVVPPLEDKRKLHDFFQKQAFDNFVQPLADYENLKNEILNGPLSNTKKKEAMRELEAGKAKVEGELAQFVDWDPKATDEEKKKYLEGVGKLLKNI
ncbi:MAG: hypothetical protein AAB897_01660 [Patescibacteria group bacterium]|mgnify:CR=1 FL=1